MITKEINPKTSNTPVESIPYESDHYVRNFKFESDFEMLCQAKSLMNLCLVCLQDNVDTPLGVHLNYDIQVTLEFAIKLLPIKETSS